MHSESLICHLILYLLTDPEVEEKADLGFYWV